MSSQKSPLTSLLLLHLFPALLPPLDPEEKGYYEILGLSKSATSEEQIRQAYRQLSLEWHPDKVSQRGGATEQQKQEAARIYEKIQEAYTVLSDTEKRQQYHSVGCSPTRYRFLFREGGTDPMGFVENLRQASILDRSRIVIFVAVLLACLMLQPILVAAKINHLLDGDPGKGQLEDADWTLIFLPLWVGQGVGILMWSGIYWIVRSQKQEGKTVLLSLIGIVLWFLSCMLVVQRWDRHIDWNWHLVSIPFYAIVFLKQIKAGHQRQVIQEEQDKMLSPYRFHQNRPPTEEDEENAEELASRHMVTMNHEKIAFAVLEHGGPGQLSEEELEHIRVSCSPEYQNAERMKKQVLQGAGDWLIIGTLLIALISAKAEGQIDASWWVVFIPYWVYVGGAFLRSCCGACGASMPVGDWVVSPPEEEQPESEDGKTTTDEHPHQKTEDKKVETSEESRKMGSMAFQHSEAKIDFTTYANETMDVQDTEVPSSSAATQEKPPTTKQQAKNAEEAEADVPDGAEEFFRAWQEEFEHEDIQEERQGALGDCCVSSFQLLVVILIVAKLEEVYDGNDDFGFNTFWILFPLFLVLGLVCCCCAYLIYGAGTLDEDDLVPSAPPDGEQEEKTIDVEEGSPVEQVHDEDPEAGVAVPQESGNVQSTSTEAPVEETKFVEDAGTSAIDDID